MYRNMSQQDQFRAQELYSNIVERVLLDMNVGLAYANELKDILINMDMLNDALNRSLNQNRQIDERIMYDLISNFVSEKLRSVQQPAGFGQQSNSVLSSGGRFATPATNSNTTLRSGFGNKPAAYPRSTGAGFGSRSSTDAAGAANAFVAKHQTRVEKIVETQHIARQVMANRGSVQSGGSRPSIIVLPDSADVELKINEIAIGEEDEFVSPMASQTVNCSGSVPTLFHSIILKTPCVNPAQAIRILRMNYPKLFSAPAWVVNVYYQALMCDQVPAPTAKVIGDAFSRVAEKLSITNDFDTFMTIFLPAIKANIADGGFVNNKLMEEFNRYLNYYFRDPENPLTDISIQYWSDLKDLMDPGSAEMRTFMNVNQNAVETMWVAILSAIKSTFPNGASPIIDPTNKENRGIIASIPQLQLKHGKYLLRDYGNMNADTWRKFEADLANSYVVRTVARRFTLTNVAQDEIMPDAGTIVIPMNALKTPVQYLSYQTTNIHTEKALQDLPISLIMGYDEEKERVLWDKKQGMLVCGDVLYF